MNKSLLITVFLLPLFLQAQITQWRGVNRDGFFNEEGLLKQWPDSGPQLVLKVENLGKGWSSAVVYKQQIYVTGLKDSMDVLHAIDQNGNILWTTPYGKSWDKSFPDTRSTPTIENGKVFLSSGIGEVVCIDASSGKVLWHNNVFMKNAGETGNWGVAENILIAGDVVVFTTGGKQTLMVALNKNTGEEVWKSKTINDEIGYVSPILVEQNGVQQIIGLSARTLYGINPKTGALVWTYDYLHIDDADWGEQGAVINCTTPIYYNGELYVTSGYNHTGAKFKLNNDLSGVEFLWKEEFLDNHHGGVILVDGYIYGSNWINNSKGNWCCLNWETGELKYEQEFDSKGSIITTPDQIYIYTEKKGIVGLVKPNSEKLEIISSFQVPFGEGANWAHPAIFNGKLYIRHGNTLMVYKLKE